MRTATIVMTEVECSVCGLVFAVPEGWNRQRREDKVTFWCPNGHGQCYRKSDADILREQLGLEQASVKFWRDQTTQAERRIAAQKGQATKLRKRLANGVCPCCHRHFTNLERHIQGQHPNYAATEPQIEVCS